SFRQIDYSSYLRAVKHDLHKKSASHKIGLVVVQGEIVDGESDDNNAGGDTIADLLDRARRDDAVEAVVLRVDSPGGSVFASEKIRRAVQQLRKDGKPVVASMSTLAASGGYWISMAADKIWAEPSTITGSIGIFGLVPTIDQPLAKLGIHTDGVGTTPLAGAFRMDRPLTPDVRTIMQSQIEKGYRDFTEGVAKARNLPLEKVQDIARGRVWSGAAAKGLGLVDELGSFDDALAAAAKLAELQPDTYQLYEFEPDRDWVKQVFGKFYSQSQFSSRILQTLLPAGQMRDQAETLQQTLHHLNDPRGEYAYCFCQPSRSDRAH
ncbi:MAG: sppA, partial [Nevskia sp.]|nr:sppA [Nevskia sp.]